MPLSSDDLARYNGALTGTSTPGGSELAGYNEILRGEAFASGEVSPRVPAVRAGDGLWDAWVSGWQSSTGGLALRGRSPEVALTQEAGAAERLVNLVGQTLGDWPTLLVGSYVGGVSGATVGAVAGPKGVAVGGLVGAGGGAFGLTEAARTWLLEQYDAGHSKRSLAERLTATAFAGAKGFTLGALTAGAGGAGAKAAGALAPGSTFAARAARGTVVTASEVTALVGVTAALEGELPELKDFAEAAVVIGGLKSAGAVAGKLREVYARTGVPPKEVAKEAAADPRLAQDLIDSRAPAVPDRYRSVSQSPLAPDPYASPVRLAMLEAAKADGGLVIRNPLETGFSPARARLGEESVASKGLLRQLDELPEDFVKFSSQLAKRYEGDVAAATRGRVPRSQTADEAYDFLLASLGDKATVAGLPDKLTRPVQWAAEVQARAELLRVTHADAWAKLRDVAVRPDAPDTVVVAAIEAFTRARYAAASFRGASAEVGRALQSLKDVRRIQQAADNQADIVKLLDRHGGREQVKVLATLALEAGSGPNFARALGKRTRFDAFIEIWKGLGLLSGPSTFQVNIFSNLLFTAWRVPESLFAAAVSRLPGGSGQVAFRDAARLTEGFVVGAVRALTAGHKILADEVRANGWLQGIKGAYDQLPASRRAELDSVHGAAGGLLGGLARVSFAGLEVGDLLFRQMNYHASLRVDAARRARAEGLAPGTPEYARRVAVLDGAPTRGMVERAEKDAARYVFQDAGNIVKALERVRRDIPALQFVLPFIRTPAGIFKETLRRTPLSPLVGQWRRDFQAGGAARDRAVAELVGGTAVGAVLFWLAGDGVITGGGHPDDKVRAAERNAGVRPYSVRTAQGQFVSYRRFEPAGTLFGLAADLAMAWELLDSGEQDEAASALIWAGVEVFKNKTWLKGVTGLVSAVVDSERYGASYVEDLTGSFVPAFLGQTAREMDPYVREVDGVLGAVQSRFPGLREGLPVKRDGYGRPVLSDQSLGVPFSPSRVSQASENPVRLKALELGVAPAPIPRTLQAGSVLGQRVPAELTAQQRDVFATESGALAHDALSRIIATPAFDSLPPLAQRALFNRVFATARRQAAYTALPPAQRRVMLEQLIAEEGL